MKLPIEHTDLHTWFERDRAHVELRNRIDDKTIVEWWDDAVAEAIGDGFLCDKGFVLGRLVSGRTISMHESAYSYADSLGLLPDYITCAECGLIYCDCDESNCASWLEAQA